MSNKEENYVNTKVKQWQPKQLEKEDKQQWKEYYVNTKVKQKQPIMEAKKEVNQLRGFIE